MRKYENLSISLDREEEMICTAITILLKSGICNRALQTATDIIHLAYKYT